MSHGWFNGEPEYRTAARVSIPLDFDGGREYRAVAALSIPLDAFELRRAAQQTDPTWAPENMHAVERGPAVERGDGLTPFERDLCQQAGVDPKIFLQTKHAADAPTI